MSLKSKFGTVKNAETEGAWVDVMQNEDGSMCRVKLRRSGRRNKDYTKSFDKHTKPYRRILDNLDPEIDAKVMRAVIVDSIVTEWENVQLEEGANLPFNRPMLRRCFPNCQTFRTSFCGKRPKLRPSRKRPWRLKQKTN